MTGTFHVRNFDRFQHYKDRAPPWIKLYNELLDDYEFSCLQDASKLHLILIWLLASRSDNKLPYDPAWLARRINASEPVDLDALVSAGFIVVDQPLQSVEQVASNTLADCKQVAIPERERETEGETEEDAPSGATEEVKKYAFESGRIRLNQRDLDVWKASFSHLDVPAELVGLTKWAGEQRDWFFAVAGALAKRNREQGAKIEAEKSRGGFKYNGIEGVL